jgi:predicted nucleic acid-binding protein
VRLVVDANLVVQLSLAGGVLGPLAGHELLAPPLMASELTSALAEMAFRREIPVDAARTALATFPSFGIRSELPAGLYERAWDLARQLGWAKTYDAEYVALALMAHVPLLTLDGRMRRAAGHLVDMPLLSELAPGT